MPQINIYAITDEKGTTVFREVDGSMSYNISTHKFSYQFHGKVHILDNVVSYKLIGHDEDAIRVYLMCEEEKKVQKIIDKLEAIKEELENDYGQYDIGYALYKVIEEIEKHVMPKEYLDEPKMY